jgi:large subunit ribosomal protein L17
MRHSKTRYQLNRFTSWRKATVLSLARNLLISQSIKTTEARAKAVRPVVEKLISLAKENTLAARRLAYDLLSNHKLVSLLFKDIGPRFTARTGGYTRIINFAKRRGDDASLVILELTEIKKKERRKPKKEKEATPEQGPRPPETEKRPTEERGTITETKAAVQEKPPLTKKKPQKKFLGGLKNIFKKERDSL